MAENASAGSRTMTLRIPLPSLSCILATIEHGFGSTRRKQQFADFSGRAGLRLWDRGARYAMGRERQIARPPEMKASSTIAGVASIVTKPSPTRIISRVGTAMSRPRTDRHAARRCNRNIATALLLIGFRAARPQHNPPQQPQRFEGATSWRPRLLLMRSSIDGVTGQNPDEAGAQD
jgi:hypothetical protein